MMRSSYDGLDEEYVHQVIDDSERFSLALSHITGKRLTWNKVTGKEGEQRQYAN